MDDPKLNNLNIVSYFNTTVKLTTTFHRHNRPEAAQFYRNLPYQTRSLPAASETRLFWD
jgi:hypothetical protein